MHVGTDKLQASLKRVVAGLKVIVKDKDNGVLSSNISGIDAHIGNISEKVNAYTAQPVNPTRQNTGTFTVENWTTVTETIDVPLLK